MKAKLLKKLRNRFNIMIGNNNEYYAYDKKKSKFYQHEDFDLFIWDIGDDIGLFWTIPRIISNREFKKDQIKIKKAFVNQAKK